jgi:hypothetical protein
MRQLRALVSGDCLAVPFGRVCHLRLLELEGCDHVRPCGRVGQATTRLELPQPYLLAGYTLLAVVASIFVDCYSGFVLAAFGLVIGAHILGAIGHLPKVITGEIMLVAGMLFCGFSGPSGGLWERSSASVADRHSHSVAGHAASTQGAAMPSRTTD